MMIVCCSICANWTAISAIATGLSAIATLVLAIFAFFSLRQSKKQLREIKTQQEEDIRARLIFEIVSQDDHFYLKITNAGKSTAYNIQLSIKSALIDNHFSPEIKSIFEKINQRNLIMVPERNIFYPISPIITDPHVSIEVCGKNYAAMKIKEWVEQNKETTIYISGSYCNRYSINEELTIMECISYSVRVNDPISSALTDIESMLGKTNRAINELKNPIIETQKSLTKIENKIK